MSSGTHEKRDVNVRNVALAGAVLLVGCVLALVAMSVVFRYFASREAKIQTQPSPLAAARGGPAEPPEPRLQTAPADDLRRLRAAEDAALGGYGWIDEKAGTVRIPIDRAIDLVAARGLPARTAQVGSRRGETEAAPKAAPR